MGVLGLQNFAKLGLGIYMRQSHSHAAPCLIEKRQVNNCIAYGLYHFATSLARGRPSAANAFVRLQPYAVSGAMPLRTAAT